MCALIVLCFSRNNKVMVFRLFKRKLSFYEKMVKLYKFMGDTVLNYASIDFIIFH